MVAKETALRLPGKDLTDQLRALPDEAFTRLQFLAPAIGCFNQCAMCSQAAGRDVWQFTSAGLSTLAHALAGIAAERGLALAGGRAHRAGVLFPYLDNDIGSYPYLAEYFALARDVLGVRLRLCTVGYSAASRELTRMHERIVGEYPEVIDGVRFSLTPYPLGWSSRGPATSRETFTADLAAALRTYRPVMDRLGHGPSTAAVELRFAPLVGIGEVVDAQVAGRHLVAAGPHKLIGDPTGPDGLPYTAVERLDARSRPVYSRPGAGYLHVVCEGAAPGAEFVRAALAGTLSAPHTARRVTVHRFANADGDYYAVDPDFRPDGTFAALHVYPATARRPAAGYTDATRWFLNALLAQKAARGIGRRAEFPSATADDIDAVLARLRERRDHVPAADPLRAGHLNDRIIPLVTTYANALRLAKFAPADFFSPRFSIDTGQIVNQGRARALFRGLAATADEPMTPREERGFGSIGVSGGRGPVWRIAPVPYPVAGPLSLALTGGKNPAAPEAAVLVEELDPRHLAPVERDTGRPLRRYLLTGVETEHVSLAQGRAAYAMPGLVVPPGDGSAA